MSQLPEASSTGPPAPGSPSLVGRAIAIFTRPAGAWSGLDARAQWWFPMVLGAVVQFAVMLPLYERAYLPMYYEQLDAQIASGAIEPAAADKAQQIMESGFMGPVVAGTSGVMSALMTFGMALLVWVAVSFVLGARFRYRQALEVTAWSGLVWLPQSLAFFALAWTQETMKGIHFGLAAFLPEADPPSKLQAALTVLLDVVGPFNLWFLVVAVLGCAALSGVPRGKLAWALGGLAAALAVLSALLTVLLAPGT